MSDTTLGVLLGVFVLSTSIWVGGYVAIAVVARTAAATLDPRGRIAFFRSLGRAYLALGAPALVVALGTGFALLSQRDWNAVATAATIVAAVLAATLALGVVQARRMGRTRRAALAAPDDPARQEAVRRGARRAAQLRAALGVLSLALIALGSLLATT